jgi:hypothetical protein
VRSVVDPPAVPGEIEERRGIGAGAIGQPLQPRADGLVRGLGVFEELHVVFGVTTERRISQHGGQIAGIRHPGQLANSLIIGDADDQGVSVFERLPRGSLLAEK